jgi:cytochrome c-type biogenesis protein CcmH
MLVAALVLAAPAAASERHPTQTELEGELICPVCNTTLDQSDAPIALRMKEHIATWIARGETKSEIKAKLVGQFGTRVLAAPPKHGFNLLAWLMPLVGLGGAAVVVGVLAWRWSRAREPALPARGALEPELERRLDEELARFDD